MKHDIEEIWNEGSLESAAGLMMVVNIQEGQLQYETINLLW